MSAHDESTSPYATYLAHCAKGRLGYQVNADGAPIFYPRLFAPGTGEPLEWRVARGTGTVHATTTVHRPGEPPHNVALIALDEGFRMMSRVEGIEPAQVCIGMRVTVQMRPIEGPDVPLPVFTPMEDDNG